MAWERIAPGFCGVILVAVIGLCWSIGEFGSLRHAWLYANGIRVVVDTPSVRLLDGKPGDDREAAFLVYNLSGQPVQILGVKTSCGCVSTEKLPVTIPPKGIKELRVTLRLEKSPTGTVEQGVVYHTDEPSAPQLAVKVSGRVIDP